MGLTSTDIYLISPELALAGLALAVVLLDLALKNKTVVLGVAVVGLLVPIAFAVSLWVRVDGLVFARETGFNGSLVIDQFAIFFKLLLLGILVLVLLASNEYTGRFRRYQAEFTGLVFFSATGLMLLPAAGDLITVYVALELASLPIVALAAFLKMQARSTEAGLKYLVLSGVSSAVLLYGFALLYAATGTMRIVSPSAAEPSIAQMLTVTHAGLPFGNVAVLAGVVLVLAGFGFKLSMVPFQMWTPDVYEGAPTPVSAFLAVASKSAAFAVVLRVFYSALGDVSADWSLVFAALAAVTMSVGNLVAIAQSNVKRLLGYSTIAHAGYMLVGVAAIAARAGDAGDGSLGIVSVLFYLGGYAAMNLAAFFAVIAITNRTGNETVRGLAGLGQRSPLLAGMLAFALVSLTGIPPTVGFMGKLFVFNAAINTGYTWLAVIGVINSVVSAYYYLNIVRVMYLQPADGDARPVSANAPATVALAFTSIAVLLFGLWPTGLLDAARAAATALLQTL
ncbi:MAG: NADH-quinone oxidoreductase subunit N [SAR202 cluster bacterium]|nr:NADH-quinone oxidoreductase subunit N [SAR202 cluster bacterium]